MKWTFRCGAAVALMGMSAAAQAGMLGGLFSSHRSHDDCCEQPCRAVVARPCEQTYTYQRKISNLQPPCCDGACGNGDCCDVGGCAPCDAGCAPADCCAGNRCGKGGCGLFDGLFKHLRHRKGGLCDHGAGCCDAGCAGECGPPLRQGDPCEIAKLIYQAQTACYAKDREDAVDDLGDFDCRCHPEIMCALIYSLNDADEDVRKQAADEIGDLLDSGRCCCSPEVVAALTCALGDCDRGVRRQAEEALDICGYDVVEGCCGDGCCGDGCCGDGCCNVGGAPAGAVAPAVPAQAAPVPSAPAPAPTPMKKKEAAPAPAPPEDPEAYFPSRYRKQTNAKSSLSNLFTMAD